MGTTKLQPIHPGEILLEEFLKPLNISQYKLAKDISVPPRRINEIVQGKRSISAEPLGFHAILDFQSGFGSIFSHDTTLR